MQSLKPRQWLLQPKHEKGGKGRGKLNRSVVVVTSGRITIRVVPLVVHLVDQSFANVALLRTGLSNTSAMSVGVFLIFHIWYYLIT